MEKSGQAKIHLNRPLDSIQQGGKEMIAKEFSLPGQRLMDGARFPKACASNQQEQTFHSCV